MNHGGVFSGLEMKSWRRDARDGVRLGGRVSEKFYHAGHGRDSHLTARGD